MKIVNYGSMNIDNVYAVDHMARPGETLLAEKRSVFAAGRGLTSPSPLPRRAGRSITRVFWARMEKCCWTR